MAYISLYRKYRPQTFEDVVGQDHVTRTLRNAITEGRVASGYLFCGTRGTAKTTCARILAKALNCIGPDGLRTTPNPEPCGTCGPCQSIAASSFVDVLEMDAASHGKVDDVRDLVASIKFPPMEGRYKVYIIDEAHQLSRDAMDAFLKTLEEPPDRVVFILATTEQDKLPITISSRCQVFEFKRGSVTQIGARLTEVLKAENVPMPPTAVTLVARAADGSYRDSLSLLEQVLAYKREGITARDVGLVLGAVDEDVLARVVAVVAAGDAAAAFALAGEVLESGRDVRQFLKSVAARMRDLLFVGVGAQAEAAGEMDDTPALRAQASQFSPAALLHALEVLTDAEAETRRNNQHRLLLEMTLLRLMRLPNSQPTPLAMPAPPVALPVAMPAPPVAVAAVPAAVPITEAPIPAPTNGTAKPVAEPALPPAAFPELPPSLIDEDDITDLNDEEEMILLEAPAPGDDDLDVPLSAEDSEPSLLITSADDYEQAEDLLFVQQVAAPVILDKPASPAPPPDDAPAELITLQRSWQEVINRVSSRSTPGGVVVRDARPVGLTGHTFTLEFENQMFVDKLTKNEKGRQMIEEVINKTLDTPAETYKIRAVIKGSMEAIKPPVRIVNKPQPIVHEVSPLMDEVIAVFGGQVLDDSDGKG